MRSHLFVSLFLIVCFIAGCAGSDGPPRGGAAIENAAHLTKARKLQYDRRLPKGGGRYAVGKPHFTRGKWYYPKADPTYDKVGIASWYGRKFHGRKTANGEIYDMFALTTAHPTLPMPSHVEVTNLENGRRLVLRLNDRGPFIDNRLVDVSWQAAKLLGFDVKGTARVRVRYLGRAPLNGDDTRERQSARRLYAERGWR